MTVLNPRLPVRHDKGTKCPKCEKGNHAGCASNNCDCKECDEMAALGKPECSQWESQ